MCIYSWKNKLEIKRKPVESLSLFTYRKSVNTHLKHVDMNIKKQIYNPVVLFPRINCTDILPFFVSRKRGAGTREQVARKKKKRKREVLKCTINPVNFRSSVISICS